MFDNFINNLDLIIQLNAILIISIIINILIYYLKNNQNSLILYNKIKNDMFVLIIAILLSTIITLLPSILEQAKITIIDYTIAISVSSIIITYLYINIAYKYLKNIMNNINNIIRNKKTTKLEIPIPVNNSVEINNKNVESNNDILKADTENQNNVVETDFIEETNLVDNSIDTNSNKLMVIDSKPLISDNSPEVVEKKEPNPVTSVESTDTSIVPLNNNELKYGAEAITYIDADFEKVKRLIEQYNHVKTLFKYIIIHNGDNTDNDAISDVNYALNNVPDAYMSWHYSVDDKFVLRFLAHPNFVNYSCFCAGDGIYGMGNMHGINIVACEADGYENIRSTRWLKTRENLVHLVSQLLYDYNWDTSRVIKHEDTSGKNCPRILIREGFEKFLKDVDIELNKIKEKNKH